MTSRSWKCFLTWSIKLAKDGRWTKIGARLAKPIKDARLTMTRARPFSARITRPQEVAKPRKTWVGPFLVGGRNVTKSFATRSKTLSTQFGDGL
jgi:hypothetical protein